MRYLKLIVLISLFLFIFSVPAAYADYKNPPVPPGFTYVTGTWDTGYVIQDTSGNQWVWVPVGGISGGFTRRDWGFGLTVSQTSDTVPSQITTAITNSGGFYVARYEASNNGGKAASKANQLPWYNIDWYTAKAKAESMGTDYGYGSGVLTHLMYDTEWDTIVQWFQDSGVNVTNSTNYGNYWDDPVTGTGGQPANTGQYSQFAVKNIYDLAGNLWEWDMGVYSSNRLIRGGGWNYYGASYPVYYRYDTDPSNYNTNIGFRPCFVVLNSAPSVALSAPTTNQAFSEVAGYNSMTISGTVMDPDAGDKNYIQYKIDSGTTQTLALAVGKSGTDGTGDYITADGTAKPFSGTVDVNGLSEGTHNVAITAVDDKGNISAQTVVNIIIDKTAPTQPSFVFTNPAGYTSGTWTNTKPVMFTVTPGTDSGAGVLKTQYRVNGGAWTDYSGDVSVNTAGVTTVDAQTLDKVGNVSTAATVTIKINNPPSVTINTPAVNQAFSEVTGYSQINVTGTVTDADDDNCTVTATLDGVQKSQVVNNCAGGKPFSITFDVVSDNLPEGTPVIIVTADDGK